VLERGQRMAVCDKTFRLYSRDPYASQLVPVAPLVEVPMDEARAFDCRRTAKRDVRETKGVEYDLTDLSGGACCEPGGDCC